MKSRKLDLCLHRILWSLVIFLVLISVAIVIRRVGFLIPILLRGYHPSAAASNPAASQFAALDAVFTHYPILTLVHVLAGLSFVMLAPMQFSHEFRKHHLQWHRRSGAIVLLSGLVIGVSALGMSFGMPAIGGINQAAATTLFSLFFLFALGKSFTHILRREVTQHREWMIRAFSIGLAVATIRPIVGIFFATSRLSGLTPYEFFGTAFWIGFVLHLIAAESWIHWTRPQS